MTRPSAQRGSRAWTNSLTESPSSVIKHLMITSLVFTLLLSSHTFEMDHTAAKLSELRPFEVSASSEMTPLARQRRGAKKRSNKQQQQKARAKALKAYRACLDQQRQRALVIRTLGVELAQCRAAATPITDFEQKTAAFQACTDAYNAGVAQHPVIDCSALQRATH